MKSAKAVAYFSTSFSIEHCVKRLFLPLRPTGAEINKNLSLLSGLY